MRSLSFSVIIMPARTIGPMTGPRPASSIPMIFAMVCRIKRSL